MLIFSKEKFLEDNDNRTFYFVNILSVFGEDNWVNLLDGKNEKEIESLGYSVVKEAMIDVYKE